MEIQKVVTMTEMNTIQATICKKSVLIAELDYLNWGVCIGGRHFTGHITVNTFDHSRHPDFPERIEIERRISRNEAKQWAEECGRLWAKWETKTNRFNTLEHLVRYATRWCNEHLGGDWMLIDDNWYNPNEVFAAKGSMEAKISVLNAFAEKWRKVPDYERTDSTFNKWYNEWYKLLGVDRKKYG